MAGGSGEPVFAAAIEMTYHSGLWSRQCSFRNLELPTKRHCGTSVPLRVRLVRHSPDESFTVI
jgi:hypothetical protein